MKNKFGRFTIFMVLFLLSWLAISPVAEAQTPTPPLTRESLIEEIQSRAQRDVNNGKPMETIEGLNLLFGEQATQVGMTPSEMLEIYEDEYNTIKAMKPWWEGWLPNLGWVAAFIALLAAIFRGAIEEAGKKFVTTVGTAIYNRVARYRPFWMFALRRYRRSLEATYSELRIPFRSGRPLQMKDIYVPVRVDGRSKQPVDAYQTIQEQKRLIVLGEPGSGKTMLLRHIAFTYARQGLYDFPGQPIPVFLELNRVESAGNSLLDALIKTLDNHNFPGAGGFLQSAIENHSLLILLDGLDEVNVQARSALAGQIQDLSQKYPDNRIIVTCRRAVYQGELDGWVDQKLEIVEFSDQQIQRFMTSWQKDMPAEKSIEHFFRTLQERPQIMALARNPLLLTMVAYLYVDTEFALPHSRSEFYSRSTDLLLDQWKLERNRYKATHKRIVLQRLALFNQNGAGKTGERRTLELADVLKEIRVVLPDLTLKTEDAQPLLDEIVHRSGLMLVLEGGTRYQFTHLTLQEYFAARALEADQKGLLDFYHATPDAWREVVRLWCALEHDSTSMLKELYALDPVMAFECLSDAQQVDNAYADELIENFKPSLSEEIDSASLSSTFAMLAADPRPRGRKWFEFIKSNLDIKKNRLAACAVLAQTNIPQAAEPLVKLAATDYTVIPFLVQLGNLAVPALTEPAQNGEIWAMDALVAIGTPQAALALQPLLWTDEPSAYHAAWRLSSLLPLASVEEALRSVILMPEQRKMRGIEWIWEPFEENPNSPLRAITGRIAFLLNESSQETLPSNNMLVPDSRLVIPLCTIASQGRKFFKLKINENLQINEEMFEILEATPPSIIIHLQNQTAYSSVSDEDPVVRFKVDKVWKFLFSSLNSTIQSELLNRLEKEKPAPTSTDWRNIFHPIKYKYKGSLQATIINVLISAIFLISLWEIISRLLKTPLILEWSGVSEIIMGIILISLLPILWITSDWEFAQGAPVVIVAIGIIIVSLMTLEARQIGYINIFNDFIVRYIRTINIFPLYLGASSVLGFFIFLVSLQPSVSHLTEDFKKQTIYFINFFVRETNTRNILTNVITGIMFTLGGAFMGLGSVFYIWILINISTFTETSIVVIALIFTCIAAPFVMIASLIFAPFILRKETKTRKQISNVFSLLVNSIHSVLLGLLAVTICIPFFIFFVGAYGVIGIPLAYFPSMKIFTILGWNGLIIFWVVWSITYLLTIWYSVQQQRAAQNSLHGLLEPSGAAISLRRSSSLLRRLLWFWFW